MLTSQQKGVSTTEKGNNLKVKNKGNPLSGYGVSNEEFAFYEHLYKFERKAFWKGFIVAMLIVVVCILIATAM